MCNDHYYDKEKDDIDSIKSGRTYNAKFEGYFLIAKTEIKPRMEVFVAYNLKTI